MNQMGADPPVPPVDLVCPTHGEALSASEGATGYLCPSGCEFPIVNGIPRFVSPENYAEGFGLQWNAFRKTQLDSHTRTTLSRDRLRRIAGGDLGIFAGKRVLEAGCGAGRFTEVLLQHCAHVFATDLSSAVEANRANFGGRAGYFVCQADIARLPVRPGAFEIVVCVGVLQHTPNPEATMAALCAYLGPGGVLLIDHYSPDYPVTPSRRLLRNFLLKRSSRFALRFSRVLVRSLWPLHRFTYALRNRRWVWRTRPWLLRISPVVDYHEAYPELGTGLLYEWALLDTHDTLTDRYKHLRSADQIGAHLSACGMESIVTAYAGNGVEARAVKPVAV